MIDRPNLQSRVVIRDNAVSFAKGWPFGPPRGITWHATDSTRWLGSGGSEEWLRLHKAASYHYAIEDDGTIYRFLNPKLHRSYHAGVKAGVGTVASRFKALVRGESVNSTTIGIAFVAMNARVTGKLTTAQLESGLWLGSVMMEQYDIPAELNGMHREFCPTWKSDIMPENLNADHWRQLLGGERWPACLTAHP